MINKIHQKGAETVEFAMICLLLFALVFAIIEFGRTLFVWNALAEATRRAARMAVVCPYLSPFPAQVAIFNVDWLNGTLGTSPIIPGLTPAMITVSYWDKAGNPATDATSTNSVQVSINGYTNNLFIPQFIPTWIWGQTITAPSFTTTLHSESLGAVPTIPPAAPGPTACNF